MTECEPAALMVARRHAMGYIVCIGRDPEPPHHHQTVMTAPTFQVGNTYAGRFITDADAHFTVTILKRTAKFVTINHPTQSGETKRCAILEEIDGGEFIRPFGNYSMAPYCKAARLVRF